MNMNDVHEGGCLCGGVRYKTFGAPLLATVCHCTFCQRRTGSAFSEPVMFKEENVAFSGSPRVTYEHRSDESGRWLRMEFCPRCGTTVGWTVERRPGVRGIAGGSFDDPDWVRITRHIWTRSAQHWIVMPADVECLEKGSPN
jgi:hypothetical protein